MSEQNKAVMRRAIEEVWNRENFAILDEIVAEEFVIHAATPEAEVHGPAGAKQFVQMIHQAMPDIHFTIVDMVAEGDRVVAVTADVDPSRGGVRRRQLPARDRGQGGREDRLMDARAHLRRVSSPTHLEDLNGAIGAEPSLLK